MHHKFTAVILFVVIICGQVVLAHAQSTNPTPQPQQSFIQHWSQEVIFPSAVRFALTLALPPEQVSTATLTIKPESRPTVTIPLDLGSTIIVGGEITELAYIWPLPSDNQPLLFKDITFDWQVNAQSGQSAKIEDKFTFTDQRVNWLRDLPVSSNLKLTLPNGKSSTATPTPAYTQTGLDDLSTNLKQVSDLLSTNLSSIPTFDLLIYDTVQLPLCTKNAEGELIAVGSLSNTQVPCTPATADQIFTASGYNVLKLDSASLADVQAAVSDYVVRQSYEQAWAGTNVPKWFESGLTDFYSPNLKVELSAPLLTAARTNNLLQLTAMAQEPTSNTNTALWRAESYGLVVYIASQIGVDGLFNLAASAGTSPSFETAYQAALGKPIDTLLENFRRWLFTDSALNAFAFTPYQAATPSPTPSRTATLTQTPTPSRTATFTITPTVTGVLSLTPLPSKTPTWTPSPAPATNTPRPAGSLNTLTLTPARTSLAPNIVNTNLNLGLVILLVGALIVAVAAFILFRPRR